MCGPSTGHPGATGPAFGVTPPNTAPVVTAHDQTLATNALIDAASLFGVTDADLDTIEKFAFWDDVTRPESGSFVLDGVAQGAQQEIVVDAADLASLQFQAGDSLRGGTTSMCGPSTGRPGATGPALACTRTTFYRNTLCERGSPRRV